MKRPRQRIDSATIDRHLQVKMFDMPEVYKEKPDFETDDRLMLCKLFIDSFKVLGYLEFLTFQALLIIQDSWDSRPDPPTEMLGGEFMTHDPNFLTLAVLRKCLDTNYEKFVAIIRSCFKKLPILETMIDNFLLKEIKELDVDFEYKSPEVSREWLEYIGYLIKSRTRREGNTLQDRHLERDLDKQAEKEGVK